MIEWIVQHQVAATLIAMLLQNTVTQALETPTAEDGRGYRFFYRFMHALSMNIRYAFEKKFPDYIPPETNEGQK